MIQGTQYDFSDKLIKFGLSLVLAIEFLQILLMIGSFDIDDLILNLSGVIIGYGSYKLFMIVVRVFVKKED